MSWLKDLQKQLDELGNEFMFEPPPAVSVTELEIGELDLEFRKMYSLAMKWEREADEAALRAKYSRDAEQQQHIIVANKMGAKCLLLREIFWISVKEKLGLWGKDIGVRQGWKVVVPINDAEKTANPEDALWGPAGRA